MAKEIVDVTTHYDRLIDIENDPFRDPPELKEYMDKWDGKIFLEMLELKGTETVLEIGVGTGRLAAKIAPLCKNFFGIDISPKTAERARENLKYLENVSVICADFLEYGFDIKFDVVYSSLSSMHFDDKRAFYSAISNVMKQNGKFVLSIDKNRESFIDMSEYSLRIYPDNYDDVIKLCGEKGMTVKCVAETEFAYIFAFEKTW